MNLFCKMIIRCNPEIMDLITHELCYCVIGVYKDSGVMGVGKGLEYDRCLSLISFYDM